MRIVVRWVVMIVAVATSAADATAQNFEFALSLGYGHLSLDDAAGELGEQGGGRFEPRCSWAPFEQRPELRLGVGVGFSYYYDESDAGEIVVPPFVFDVDSYEDFALITPEFQISWRQRMSDRWWLEGGVGVGPAFGMYTAGDVIFDDHVDEDVDESDVGIGVRPFVRAGFRGGDRWTWGLEASYQWTDIDLGGGFGDNASEWYVGVFFGIGH